MDRLSIVVPTYNERDNIQPLVSSIHNSLSEGPGPLEYEIVIVDDDSPDRTWEEAETLQDDYPLTVIRRRNERGLSGAVLRGIKETEGEYILVMDADFQHPPKFLPDLIQPLLQGEDVVLASRFLEDSEIKEFGMIRTLIALAANGLARLLLKEVRSVKDVLAGFFAFRREVLPRDFPEPAGYKIVLTILVHGEYDSVKEIAYTFDQRRAGESKLGLKNIYWFLNHLKRLYLSSN